MNCKNKMFVGGCWGGVAVVLIVNLLYYVIMRLFDVP